MIFSTRIELHEDTFVQIDLPIRYYSAAFNSKAWFIVRHTLVTVFAQQGKPIEHHLYNLTSSGPWTNITYNYNGPAPPEIPVGTTGQDNGFADYRNSSKHKAFVMQYFDYNPKEVIKRKYYV